MRTAADDDLLLGYVFKLRKITLLLANARTSSHLATCLYFFDSNILDNINKKANIALEKI